MEDNSYPVPQMSFMNFASLQSFGETSNSSRLTQNIEMTDKGGKSDFCFKHLSPIDFKNRQQNYNSKYLTTNEENVSHSAIPRCPEMAVHSPSLPEVSPEAKIKNEEDDFKSKGQISKFVSFAEEAGLHSDLFRYPTKAVHSSHLSKISPETKINIKEGDFKFKVKFKDRQHSGYVADAEAAAFDSQLSRLYPMKMLHSSVSSHKMLEKEGIKDFSLKCLQEDKCTTVPKKRGINSDLYTFSPSKTHVSQDSIEPKIERKMEESSVPHSERLSYMNSEEEPCPKFTKTKEMEDKGDSPLKQQVPTVDLQDGQQYSKYVTVTKEREGNSNLSRCPSRVMQIIFDSDEDEDTNSGDITNPTSLGKEKGGDNSVPSVSDDHTKLKATHEAYNAFNDPVAVAATTSQGVGSESFYRRTTELFQTFLQTTQQHSADMMKKLASHPEMLLSMGNPYGLSNPGSLIGSSLLLNSMIHPCTPSLSLPGVGLSPGTGVTVSAVLGGDPILQGTSLEKKPPKEKRHKCTLCGKSFGRSSDLKRHVRIHTGEKNHKCLVCDKAFNQSGDLQRHMKTHTGEKPHVCIVCTKAFAQSGDLKIHMRIHTGEKPHVCSVCNKAFNQSSYLTTHMKSHTGERSHVCFVCNKAFIENSDLKKHMRIHTGEKPHECSICNKAFNRNNNLIRHIMNIHAREKPT